jgi:chromosome segregation ATPase
MSQTETLMLIALGFALAFVLVLLFGRAIWNLAMRLGARRQAKQIPVAMLELQADRDRLRADHAMMSRKLELRLEDIKTRMTEQMAEVSRHRNRVQTMIMDIERRNETIKLRDKEVAALSAQLEVYKADLAACYDTIEKLNVDASSSGNQLAKQTAMVAQLSVSLREKNMLLGNLNRDLQSSKAALEPSTTGSDKIENRLLQRVAELTSISSEMSTQQASNPFVSGPAVQLNEHRNDQAAIDTTARQANLQQQLADTERESAAMTEQIQALDSMLTPDQQTDTPKKSGAMANVISLAQRIRALQRINE